MKREWILRKQRVMINKVKRIICLVKVARLRNSAEKQTTNIDTGLVTD